MSLIVLFVRIALRNHLLHNLITDLSEPQPHFQVLLQLTGVKLGFNTAVVLLKQLQRFGGNRYERKYPAKLEKPGIQKARFQKFKALYRHMDF